jgi:hypothetical protein
MRPALVLLAVLVPGTVFAPAWVAPGWVASAWAQPRPFTCIGAEQLEEDVFAIPFARGAATPGDAARTNLAAAAERAKREPGRMLCILGHAGPQEGGAQSGLQLAAKRAGEVAAALARLGIERDRIRAEARRAAFAKGSVPAERSVTVVLLPAGVGAEPAAEPPARAPEAPAGVPAGKPAGTPAEKPAAAPAEKPAAPPAEKPAGEPARP